MACCSARYRELGGLGGALASSAAALLDRLGETNKEPALRALLALVEPGINTANSRRRISRRQAVAANGFGLHDMHGNVWEWCEDAWNAGYSESGRPDDGSPWLTGSASRRVVRGGSWKAGSLELRSASRSNFSPIDRGNDIGFRLARTLASPDG